MIGDFIMTDDYHQAIPHYFYIYQVACISLRREARSAISSPAEPRSLSIVQMSAVQAARRRRDLIPTGNDRDRPRSRSRSPSRESDVTEMNATHPNAMMLDANMLPGSLHVMQCQIAQYVNHASQTCAQELTK